MNKVLRNTVFTIVAVGMTYLALSWNKDAVGVKQPLSERISAVSKNKATGLDVILPLKVTLAGKTIRLGQYQEVMVKTTAGATIEVSTLYPNTTEPQVVRAVANASGEYTLKYKLESAKYLGTFTTTVSVSDGAKSSKETQQFVLQKWVSKETRSGTEYQYSYPLLP